MATKTKTKTATKTKAATKKTSATKAKAPKASKGAAAAKKTINLLEVGSFCLFLGYADKIADNEAFFKEGDKLYINKVNESEDGVLYEAYHAHDVAQLLDKGADAVDGGEVGTAEVKTLKGHALEALRTTALPIKNIGKMASLIKKAKGDLIALSVALNSDVNEAYFYLGGAIAKVRQSGAYHVDNGGVFKGEDAFADFCQETYGFKASKAQTLARIYLTLSGLKSFKIEMLKDLGWSKAAMMERYVTDDNLDSVVEVAGDHSQRELAVALKERFEGEKGETPSGKSASRGSTVKHVKMLFTLQEDSAESVQLTIAECMKMHGLDKEEEALEHILVEWANDHVQVKTRVRKIKTAANKAKKSRTK